MARPFPLTDDLIKMMISLGLLDAAGNWQDTDQVQTKSADYTMVIADSGLVTKIDTDAKVITLPATVAGLTYIFENAGADGAVLITISPNAADAIQGGGLTAVDNKDLLNTKATARKGDRVKLVGDGTVGWVITYLRGIWAKEA